jgi:hypothetical protein
MSVSEVAATISRATLEVEIQFNHGDRPPFIAHVTDGIPDSIEGAFEAAAFVAEYTLIGRAGDTRRYQIRAATSLEEQLGDHVEDLSGLPAIATTDATIEPSGVNGPELLFLRSNFARHG